MGHNNQDLKVTWLDSNLVHGSQFAAGSIDWNLCVHWLRSTYNSSVRALREWNDAYQIIEYNWIVSSQQKSDSGNQK